MLRSQDNIKMDLKQHDLKLAHNMIQGRAFVQSKIDFWSHKKQVTFR